MDVDMSVERAAYRLDASDALPAPAATSLQLAVQMQGENFPLDISRQVRKACKRNAVSGALR